MSSARGSMNWLILLAIACSPGAPSSTTTPPPPPPVEQSGSRGDPSQLPLATHQAPAFDRYTGATLTAGQNYIDPVTGVRVWKVTDANTPAANSSGMHDYATGPVQISRDFGSDHHTLLVATDAGRWLVDFQRAVGLSNWRHAPSVNTDLCFTFSNNPSTPQIAYYLTGNSLHRFNSATNKDEPTGNFPKSFSSVTSAQLIWIQQSVNDGSFVMMTRDQSTILAWNSVTDVVKTKSSTQLGLNIDEPHLERSGRYVLVRSGSNAWKAWDLATDALVADQPQGQTHPAAVRGLFTAFDPNDGTGPYWRYDPSAHAFADFLRGGAQVSVAEQHRGDQWIQSDDDLNNDLSRQWLLFDDMDDGRLSLSAWSLDAGNVYSATVTLSNWYDNAKVGVRAVRQFVAGDSSRVALSLASVSSRAAMTEGTFFYDSGAARLYTWPKGGANPTGLEPQAPCMKRSLCIGSTEVRSVCSLITTV